MELTITFFIEFALGLHIVLALFFIISKKNKVLHPFYFPSLFIDFFQKFSIFNFHYLKFGRHYVDDGFLH
ncbi:cytochrome b subunit of formate dehydrogenase [Flavobacterium sp. HSC-32F16]|nr:cytochrome b subunit of formate dehydrogenase [Flavobacterium sp. HSC-32F16]